MGFRICESLSWLTYVFRERHYVVFFIILLQCSIPTSQASDGSSQDIYIRRPGVRRVRSGQDVTFEWTIQPGILSSVKAIDIVMNDGTGAISWLGETATKKDLSRDYEPIKTESSIGFTLRNVRETDAGLRYKCNIFYKGTVHSDDYGDDDDSAFIVVERPPSVPNITTNIQFPDEGEDIELRCTAKANSLPPSHALDIIYTWRVDGVQLGRADDRHILIENDKTLYIKNVRDAVYACWVKEGNSSQSNNADFIIKVKKHTTVSEPLPLPVQTKVPITEERTSIVDAILVSTSARNELTQPHKTEKNQESSLDSFLKYGAGTTVLAVLLLVVVLFIVWKFRRNKAKEKNKLKETCLPDPEELPNPETNPDRDETFVKQATESVQRRTGYVVDPTRGDLHSYTEIGDGLYSSIDENQLASHQPKPPLPPPNEPHYPPSEEVQNINDHVYLRPLSTNENEMQGEDLLYLNVKEQNEKRVKADDSDIVLREAAARVIIGDEYLTCGNVPQGTGDVATEVKTTTDDRSENSYSRTPHGSFRAADPTVRKSCPPALSNPIATTGHNYLVITN